MTGENLPRKESKAELLKKVIYAYTAAYRLLDVDVTAAHQAREECNVALDEAGEDGTDFNRMLEYAHNFSLCIYFAGSDMGSKERKIVHRKVGGREMRSGVMIPGDEISRYLELIQASVLGFAQHAPDIELPMKDVTDPRVRTEIMAGNSPFAWDKERDVVTPTLAKFSRVEMLQTHWAVTEQNAFNRISKAIGNLGN